MYPKRTDRRIVALAVVLVVADVGASFFLLVRPAATGYVVYQEIKSSNVTVKDYTNSLSELRSILLSTEQDLVECNDNNKAVLRKIDSVVQRATECEGRKGALEVNLSMTDSMMRQRIASLQGEVDTLTDEIKQLNAEKRQFSVAQRRDYDVLAQNLANNICCKERVDNPDISHFRVENHKIICLEDGADAISCPQ